MALFGRKNIIRFCLTTEKGKLLEEWETKLINYKQLNSIHLLPNKTRGKWTFLWLGVEKKKTTVLTDCQEAKRGSGKQTRSDEVWNFWASKSLAGANWWCAERQNWPEAKPYGGCETEHSLGEGMCGRSHSLTSSHADGEPVLRLGCSFLNWIFNPMSCASTQEEMGGSPVQIQ